MRSRTSNPGRATTGTGTPTRRPRRPGRRGLAGAAVAMAGTAAGLAAAGLVAGAYTAPQGRQAGLPHGSGAAAARSAAGSAGGRSAAVGARPVAASGQAGLAAASAGQPGTQQPGAQQPSARQAAAGQAGVASAGAAGPHGRGRAGHGAAATRTLRTSCRSVAHIGDSTSVDLVSAAFLPDPAQRLAARYAAVGVRHLKVDASGGRSIVEEMPGQVNGYKVASAWRSQGYRGCWVFALGTNDTANVAAGSSVGMMARIDQMMAVAHGQPVMWVNTRTLLNSGPWASANERNWDKTLVKALARYPNMRIFNWSAVARPGWFLPDGIHYSTLGCAMRARAIADALARAFPARGHSAGQIVR